MESIGMSDRRSAAPGLLFRLWLVLVLLAGLWTAYRLGMVIEDLVSHGDPKWAGDLRWALPTLLALALVHAFGAALMLLRLRFGFHLLLVETVAGVAIALHVGIPLSTMAIGLIGLAVLIVLTRLNWSSLR
jgi:hypothetical protein